MGTRLFIGNLSYNVTEQELREAFTGDGIELRSVRVALDRETGRPRGFAFVETMTDDGAKASIEKLSGPRSAGTFNHRRGSAGETGRAASRRVRRPAASGRIRRTAASRRIRPAARADRADLPAGPAALAADRADLLGPEALAGRAPAAERPATSGPRVAREASAPARLVAEAPTRRRAASARGPKRNAPPAPSRKRKSAATGGGTATTTNDREPS